MALTRRVKDALDPQGILNPGRHPLTVEPESEPSPSQEMFAFRSLPGSARR